MRAWRKFISAGGLKPIMLSLVDVSAGYSSLHALFGVSLEVAAGETVGVIGPNGAGKTTLMRVISGLVAAFAGAITLDGRSIVGVPAHRIVEHGIAHVPENRRLFPRLTVEDNLRIGAFIPSARHHFAEQLAWVYQLFPQLRERRHQPAGTLSSILSAAFARKGSRSSSSSRTSSKCSMWSTAPISSRSAAFAWRAPRPS